MPIFSYFSEGQNFPDLKNLFLDQTHTESNFSEVCCVYLTKSKSVLESLILANNSSYSSTVQNPLSLSAGLEGARNVLRIIRLLGLKKCEAIYFSSYLT